MPVPLKLVMALPKLRHLTEDEAARRLGITRAELDEANGFALVAFADPDPGVPAAKAVDRTTRGRARPRAEEDAGTSAQGRGRGAQKVVFQAGEFRDLASLAGQAFVHLCLVA